jgi:hypothetical protein
MAAINYLFPPDKINDLPTWRFILHFKAPNSSPNEQIKNAIEQLKAVALKAVTFPFGVETLSYEAKNATVAVAIEVSESRRKQLGSLADYESDFWKICAAMMKCGFSDVYYQAADWKQ